MKKYTLPLTALAALTFALGLPRAIAETVRLTNPGFEDGVYGWNVPDSDGGMSQASGAAADEGETGLRVADDTAEAGSNFRSSRFSVLPGETITVTFRARTVDGDGIGVYLHFWNGDDNLISRDEGGTVVCQIPKKAREWETYTLTATVPSGAVKGELQIHSYQKSKVTADFDSFKVEKSQ